MTPDNISEQQFRTSFRGFDAAEVRAFLAEVADGVRGLLRQNEVLTARIASLESRQQGSDAVDERMRAVLAEMEGTAAVLIEQARSNAAAVAAQAEHERQRVKTHAREEAALILRDAERKAQRIVEDAQGKRNAVLEEIGQLHARRATLVARIKSLLASQIEFLRVLERDARDATIDTPTMPPEEQRREGLSAARLQGILSAIDAGDVRRQ